MSDHHDVIMCLQSAHLSPERQHDQHKLWQLPGLTGSDAIKPEEWQSFCTKVEQPLPLGELQQSVVDAKLPGSPAAVSPALTDREKGYVEVQDVHDVLGRKLVPPTGSFFGTSHPALCACCR